MLSGFELYPRWVPLIGMFANIIPINILQVVNEGFCIESRVVTNLSFVVWKECFTVRR